MALPVAAVTPRTLGKGPWDTITITAERKKQGFTSIGKVVINKQSGAKKFEAATGFFIELNNPKK